MYNKILKDEFGIKYEKPYNPDDLSYEEEFGHSFEEKQNWEKIKDQLFKKYNFDVFNPKDLKNYQKIEDEAKQVYIDKYGPPKYKKYPF